MSLKTNAVLIDARNVRDLLPAIKAELGRAEVYGFDIETEDEGRHQGLNVYNTEVRKVFDHRRTTITGFSTHVEGSENSYYFNMMQADIENRLPRGFAATLLAAVHPDAILVAHNAPFELVMTEQCWGQELNNVVCTLQMAVSHHGPDEYDLDKFYATPLSAQFLKLVPDILTTWSTFEQGDRPEGRQQELLGKFIAKESKAEHSYNGFWKSIAKGYNLKALTKSRFGVTQQTYKEVLAAAGAKHMGELTGPQVVAYGADDAFWAVKHYRWMFDDLMKTNPAALVAFFETENPMIHVYADAWREGIRLDMSQVFERRSVERHEMAVALRAFKAEVKALLPFPDEPHPKMVKHESYYDTDAKVQKKRKAIEAWVSMPDSDDDLEQCFQVSNPIGNAWTEELGLAVPKGKLNLIHYMTMRSIIYDLARVPFQYADGKVQSDADARGVIREKLEKTPGTEAAQAVMKRYQQMAEIEQRMKLYLTPYTLLMDPETARVYPSLSSQLATRRLATSFPNPMQLAKQGESAYIRSFYLGDTDDDVVVSADWSAIELVLIGDQSGDPGFAKVYGQLPYGDMHSGAAVDALSVKTLPGLTEEEFREFKFGRNPENRVLRNFSGVDLSPSDYYKFTRGTPVGKGVNFSYWYSGALMTVANNLGWNSEEHWAAVEKYRARFSVAEGYRVGLQDEAAMNGFITLPDGHKRVKFEATKTWGVGMKQKFADITAAPALLNYADVAIRRLQSRAKNQVVNAMIQGTCATLAKRSILRLLDLCEAAGMPMGIGGPRLMMPIHDELVFSVPRHLVMAFIPLLRQAMTEHQDIVKHFPLNCTVAIGRTFRPFNKLNPKFSQIELDEAQMIEGVVPKDLEGSKLSDDKVQELLEWMYA